MCKLVPAGVVWQHRRYNKNSSWYTERTTEAQHNFQLIFAMYTYLTMHALHKMSVNANYHGYEMTCWCQTPTPNNVCMHSITVSKYT